MRGEWIGGCVAFPQPRQAAGRARTHTAESKHEIAPHTYGVLDPRKRQCTPIARCCVDDDDGEELLLRYQPTMHRLRRQRLVQNYKITTHAAIDVTLGWCAVGSGH